MERLKDVDHEARTHSANSDAKRGDPDRFVTVDRGDEEGMHYTTVA
jgi:hypothetical protein